MLYGRRGAAPGKPIPRAECIVQKRAHDEADDEPRAQDEHEPDEHFPENAVGFLDVIVFCGSAEIEKTGVHEHNGRDERGEGNGEIDEILRELEDVAEVARFRNFPDPTALRHDGPVKRPGGGGKNRDEKDEKYGE